MKSKKVLIVDDNEMNRSLFENLVSQQWTYKSAKNGMEAVELAINEKFDLILMDLQLPILDGIAAFRKITQSNPDHCPVIAISGTPDSMDKAGLLSIGFVNLIVKPIKPREFIEILASYLEPATSKFNGKSEGQFPEVIIDMKVINQLMKYNSEEKINSVMSDFLEELNKLMILINSAYSTQNHLQLCENLHILKGVSGTIGANLIFLSSKKAEHLALNQSWEDLGYELDILSEEREKLEVFIISDKIFEK